MKNSILSLMTVLMISALSGCATTDAQQTDAFSAYHAQPQAPNAMENASKMISY